MVVVIASWDPSTILAVNKDASNASQQSVIESRMREILAMSFPAKLTCCERIFARFVCASLLCSVAESYPAEWTFSISKFSCIRRNSWQPIDSKKTVACKLLFCGQVILYNRKDCPKRLTVRYGSELPTVDKLLYPTGDAPLRVVRYAIDQECQARIISLRVARVRSKK